MTTKFIRTVTAIALVLVLCVSTFLPVNAATQQSVIPTFTDVPFDQWYACAVYWAATFGITVGTTKTLFSPDTTCTRSQIVTFLWRFAGSPAPTNTSNPFTDTEPGEFYYKAVLWAVENNITTGTGHHKFSPNDPCTREQVITFLYRASGCPSIEGLDYPFTDISDNSFARPAILWAYNNGITVGTSAHKFSPKQSCTRAQVVTFLWRTAQYNVKRSIDTHTHSYHVFTLSPNCILGGFTIAVCKCGHITFTDYVPALGHDIKNVITEATCTSEGYTIHYCTRCNLKWKDSIKSALGHNYVATIMPPTNTTAGYTLHTCKRCGDSYKDAYVNPTHPSGKPTIQQAANAIEASGNAHIVELGIYYDPSLVRQNSCYYFNDSIVYLDSITWDYCYQEGRDKVDVDWNWIISISDISDDFSIDQLKQAARMRVHTEIEGQNILVFVLYELDRQP